MQRNTPGPVHQGSKSLPFAVSVLSDTACQCACSFVPPHSFVKRVLSDYYVSRSQAGLRAGLGKVHGMVPLKEAENPMGHRQAPRFLG